jgi:hypothetical protein
MNTIGSGACCQLFKCCKVCGETKSIHSFQKPTGKKHKRKTSSGTRRGYCRPCEHMVRRKQKIVSNNGNKLKDNENGLIEIPGKDGKRNEWKEQISLSHAQQ